MVARFIRLNRSIDQSIGTKIVRRTVQPCNERSDPQILEEKSRISLPALSTRSGFHTFQIVCQKLNILSDQPIGSITENDLAHVLCIFSWRCCDLVKAAVLVTASPGKVDDVAKKVGELGVKDVLTVTGRVDVVVFLEGPWSEVTSKIKDMFEVEEVMTTETLWEVES